MADSEDWRRQRAEELRLHDAGPVAARPARERQPVIDSVEPMQQPVAPVPPSAPLPEPLLGRIEPRRGAEPAARRYRPQSPLVSGAADVPLLAGAMPDLPRPPGAPSFAARHPLVLSAGIAAALTGAGALGWVLRAKVEPVRTIVTVTRQMPAATALHGKEVPASDVAARDPLAENVAPPPTMKSAPSQQLATAPKPSRGLVPEAASSEPQSREPSAPDARPVDPRTVLATVTPTPVPDPTSRFAHPAKAVALPGRDFSPSFDCGRATSATNRAICASPELSALDRQMSQAFYRVTAHTELERHKAIDRDQVDFLNQRASCSSDECITKVYRQRLNELYHAASREAEYDRVSDPAAPNG